MRRPFTALNDALNNALNKCNNNNFLPPSGESDGGFFILTVRDVNHSLPIVV
jgi:hypothetical protein